MKKMVITGLIIFMAAITVGIGVKYIKDYASSDVNTYICNLQNEWGVPAHFHFKNADGTDFSCTPKPKP